MSSSVTKTTIVNRALQLLGYQPVGSINDNDRGAAAMRTAYTPRLEACLRENYWSFSIKRISLAASATTPAFGKAFYYPLPGDFLMIAPPDQSCNYTFNAIPVGVVPTAAGSGPTYNDWQIESFPGGGNAIVSDQVSPLLLRYVSSAIVEGSFDPSFAEALASDLAMSTCEELTQSNTKKADAEKAHDGAIELAKKRNAFEIMPVQPPVDGWILARM